MAITFSNRIAAAAGAAALAAGLQALAWTPGAAGPPPGGRVVVQDVVGAAGRTAAVRHWTPARMAAALRAAGRGPAAQGYRAKPAVGQPPRRLVRKAPPAPPAAAADTAGRGLRWTRRGAVAAAAGKVFFTLDGEDYVCSGALVGGEHPDLVLTAAHCVSGGQVPGGQGKASVTRWATNWMFVPGFGDGAPPHGEYTARRFFVSPDWPGPAGGREQYDAAFVQVTSATLNGASGPAQPPPGLPVRFAGSQDAAPPGPAYVFGYPADLPYSGLHLNYCAGPVAASGGSVRLPCGMTAGDSGGPWLAGFSPRTGGGTVVAVSTFKLSGDMRVLYGALLGPQARALYLRALSLAG